MPLDTFLGSPGALGLGRVAEPDPFDDPAVRSMPRNVSDSLRWAESLRMIDGTFDRAMKRVRAYFVTDVEVKPRSRAAGDPGDRQAKDKYEAFLNKTFRIKSEVTQAFDDLLTYGISFYSVLQPFRRMLSCPNCPGAVYPLATVYNDPKYKFAWEGYQFVASCARCGKRGPWTRHDHQLRSESGIRGKRWNPHDIDLLWDASTGDIGFVWRIDRDTKRQAREGRLFNLERLNWAIVEAVRDGKNILFHPGVVHMMCQPTLAGIRSQGWPIPAAVITFRQTRHKRILERANESLCSEFLQPMRVLSPPPASGSEFGDPILSTDLGGFRARTAALVRRHRMDPGEVLISPDPINYQVMGGEATQLAPTELIDQATDTQLNALGVPAEFYRGTMTLQAAPVGLRAFESMWTHEVDEINGLVMFVVDRVAEILGWEPVDAAFKRVTYADDLNKQMAFLQLMQARQISQRTALGTLGVDFDTEQDNMIDEAEVVARKQQEAQKRQQEQGTQSAVTQQAQQAMQGGQPAQPQPAAGGAAPAGGDPSQSDPNRPTTLQELGSQADQIAQRCLAMSDTQRQSELVRIRRDNPVLAAIVSDRVAQYRRQAQTAGGAQVLAATFGGGNPQGGAPAGGQPQQKAARFALDPGASGTRRRFSLAACVLAGPSKRYA